jgi:protein-tyrosine phosphatase
MQRPHNNTYWVEPGRLLAGEYPGAWIDRDARIRLASYLDCGVTDFLDLTFPEELRPYDHLLASLAEERMIESSYRRIPLADMDVPDKPETMNTILSHIDDVIETGGVLYVHCWGGIGRTGTTIGCYLVRQGESGQDALQDLARLWPSMAKSDRYPMTPQTDEQMAYVRNWEK